MGTEAQDDRRIWVGNLDTRLTEFQLLKIVQKCGQIEKFDMLFHKNGPLVGQSRGYAFVTFKSADSSVKALHKLNGQYIGKKPLAVRLAKNLNYDELEKPKPRIEIPALGTRPVDSTISKEDAIRAIEAKLNVLEKRTLDEEIEMTNNSSTCQTPIIQKYQFNKNNDGSSSTRGGFGTRMQFVKHRGSSRPYNRNSRPKRR
ncbi:probable RNA-binding protein 18 isoform X1 [Episyrphus balteatus]|uniref:probable RNA-binding protein 18 isoform X1 n=1 Tax=Episyrphus balteatus TaxID=286459 RepID=UPI0024865ACA|nr:probable RNA-binding protein 18 isoform X1 [Episyrphus balteatus]